MTARLALPERQVTALCRGAAKAGCVAVVRISGAGDLVVRFIPESSPQAKSPIDAGNNDDLDRELEAFEAKHGDD